MRPTSDQLRETLFNILAPRIVGSKFVDCFAGSGAVGIEALSRGAAHVTFIEQHFAALECIRHNLLTLEIQSGFSIIQRDVISALSSVGAFDICFLDPPYAELPLYDGVLSALGQEAGQSTDALVIAEHARRRPLQEKYGKLNLARVKVQGDSQLSFFTFNK